MKPNEEQPLSVTAYYSAIGHHDTSGAAQLLAPEVRQHYQSASDSDFTNVVSLANIRDVKEGVVGLPGGVPAGYHDVTQVAPWMILSIGTGP